VGRYRVRVQATDAQSRVSPPLERVITLRLTPPRGRLDAYVMPLWNGMARSLGIPARGGQLVAAVAPGGDVLKSGIRRGDVITGINGKSTLTPGAMATALRALPADTDVPVTIRRGTEERTVTLKVPPDWNAVPDLSRTLTVVVRRNPRSMAYGVAYARYLVEQGKADDAQELIDAWPRSWRTSAPGQAVQAQLFERSGQAQKALASWNRARAKDPRMPAAAFGRAIALNSLGKDAEAAEAFGDAFRLDPSDASAGAFRAFSLIRAENIPASREAALAAEALDPEYADGKVAAGIALIQTRNPARGVVKLREGLILTDDAARAQTIIDQYLEPADK
jgi:tetratricopeptide (TPR) repeat protein